jgi:hypothetical protein
MLLTDGLAMPRLRRRDLLWHLGNPESIIKV